MTGIWLPYTVQLLHVLAGVFFISMHVLSHVSARTHGQLPAAQGRAARQAMFKPLGPFMPVTALFIFGLGLLRGTVFGPIRSWDALLATPYGNTFLFALVATIVYMAWSGKRHGALENVLWENDAPNPVATAHLNRFLIKDVLFLAVIVGAMVAMRFGL